MAGREPCPVELKVGQQTLAGFVRFGQIIFVVVYICEGGGRRTVSVLGTASSYSVYVCERNK